MNIAYYLVLVLHVIACLFLIGVVLLQQGKSQDLASAFGGGGTQTAFGPRGSANVLSRATTVLAGLFMVTSLALSMLRPHESSILDRVNGPSPAPAASARAAAPIKTVPASTAPAATAPAARAPRVPEALPARRGLAPGGPPPPPRGAVRPPPAVPRRDLGHARRLLLRGPVDFERREERGPGREGAAHQQHRARGILLLLVGLQGVADDGGRRPDLRKACHLELVDDRPHPP